MNLYIEIENGQTKNHPALEHNLIESFGVIPENWEPFIRIEKPTLDTFQILVSEQTSYEKINGVWTDVWHKRDMTAEERAAKIAQAMQYQPFPSWVFSEETCMWDAPVPRPDDFSFEKAYYWDEPTLSWIAQTPVAEV